MHSNFKLLLIIAIAAFLIVPAKNAFAVKSTCDFHHKECFTEAGYIACFKKIDAEKYYEFLDSGQVQLANQLRDDPGRCKVLRGNKKAFMQDKSLGLFSTRYLFFSGFTRVPPSSTTSISGSITTPSS